MPAHAAASGPSSYQRRRPELTALYQCVARRWPESRERARGARWHPAFVEKEVEAYLRCGLLEQAFTRLGCTGCGHEHLVPFSCKQRGFCPSCLGRRMSDMALHLNEAVLPAVPIRQWVCQLPRKLRYRLGYDRELSCDVLDAFARELLGSLRLRAKCEPGLTSTREAHPGAVTVAQRFDSELRLNVHFHTLALDDIHVENDVGTLAFHGLRPPSQAVACRRSPGSVGIATARGAERLAENWPALGERP